MRDIVTIDEMRATEAIQREVWGLPDIDIVPAAQLKAAVHAGGQLAGAFDDGFMIGFAYGLVATPHGQDMDGCGLHSHMVAVTEQGRHRGVGRALKWSQRRWCLERGMSWITWTFDPLQARNAKLNFEHLGAISHEYLVDFYGVMAGPLGGSASDRLVALWLLDSEPVMRHAAAWSQGAGGGSQDPIPHLATTRDLWVLREEDIAAAPSGVELGVNGAGGAGSVLKRSQEFQAALADVSVDIRLRVAAPHDVGSLKRSQPEVVERWRSGIRAAIIPALAVGFAVVGFSDGAYVLQRTEASRKQQKSK